MQGRAEEPVQASLSHGARFCARAQCVMILVNFAVAACQRSEVGLHCVSSASAVCESKKMEAVKGE